MVISHELYSWLRLEKENGVAPPCYCHFPQYDEHFFKSLTAEKLVTKIVRGYKRTEWVKDYDRNEVLDTWCYARAAASIIGLDRLRPEQIKSISSFQQKIFPESAYDERDAPMVKQPEIRVNTRRSSFWN